MADKKYLDYNGLARLLENLVSVFAPKTHNHTVSELSDYTVDTALSDTSTNPVTNQAIKSQFDAVDSKIDTLESSLSNGNVVVSEATHASTADSATNAANANYASTAGHANTATTATNATHATTADSATTAANAANAEHASTSDFATNANHAVTADSATKATQDASGNVITNTYETKVDAAAKLTEAKSYADTAIADLVNSAPETLDTLGELAAAFQENEEVVDALNDAITNKADKSEIVQSDWNQNNTDSMDYVKNRTHYTDDSGTVIQLDEKYIPDTIARVITEEEMLEIVAEINLVDPITDENGSVYTDEFGNVYTL